MRKLFTILALMICCTFVYAQDKYEITTDDYGNSGVEMADTFRKEGKIYVVVGVTMIILLGLFSYTALTDRKISRLERMVNERTEGKS